MSHSWQSVERVWEKCKTEFVHLKKKKEKKEACVYLFFLLVFFLLLMEKHIWGLTYAL